MRKSVLIGSLLAIVSAACGGASKEAARSPSPPAMEASGGTSTAAPGEGFSADAPATPASAPRADAEVAVASAPAKSAPAAIAARAVEKSEMPVARPEPVRELPQSGQLTAGVWDDNRNFDFFKPYASTFRDRNGQDFAMFGEQEIARGRELAAQAQGHTELDVQLVLDTTGSMGDELSYLQSEFDAIASKVHTKFPNVTPRWSLVVYRDKGDDYVTREFDFTTDTVRFRRDLRAQSAGGGGDTPEAVVQGIGGGMKQHWRRESNVAKLMFWVADAPAHPGEGRVLANVLRDAQHKGVHIYPIASSDTDDAAEYQMRSAAQVTGGRYVFLTNDSGVGNAHAEPHIPCYSVTRLDGAIVRMIQVELSGRHIEPEANEVVRSVGRPNKEGQCKLASGMLVASY